VILDLDGLHELETFAQSNGIKVVSVFIQVSFLIRLYRAVKRGSFSLIEFTRRSIDDYKKMKNGMFETTVALKNKGHVDVIVNKIIDVVKGDSYE
jgi:uridine kinase